MGFAKEILIYGLFPVLSAVGAGHGAHQLQGTPPRRRRAGARQSKSSSVGSAPQGRASPAVIWKARLLSGTGSSRRRVEKAPADTAAPYRSSAVAHWAAEPFQDSRELHGLVSIPPPPFLGSSFFLFLVRKINFSHFLEKKQYFG